MHLYRKMPLPYVKTDTPVVRRVANYNTLLLGAISWRLQGQNPHKPSKYLVSGWVIISMMIYNFPPLLKVSSRSRREWSHSIRFLLELTGQTALILDPISCQLHRQIPLHQITVVFLSQTHTTKVKRYNKSLWLLTKCFSCMLCGEGGQFSLFTSVNLMSRMRLHILQFRRNLLSINHIPNTRVKSKFHASLLLTNVTYSRTQ